jgi:hypothetical protein
VFILYALLAGLIAGRLLGGRLDRLAGLELRWKGLALAGLLVQVALFSRTVSASVGEAGPWIYVSSTGAVLLFVLANVRLPGFWLIAVGSLANLLAILANGGYMPTSAAALAVAGLEPTVGYSNSVVLADPALAPLTDVLAMPAWMPLANVFSLGDLLIGLGVAFALVWGMRLPAAEHDGFAAPVRRILRLGGPPAGRARVDPLARLAGHEAVLAVTPRSMISTNGVLLAGPPAPTVGTGGDVRRSVSLPSRANPSRGGDAKPGIFGRPKTAQLPGSHRPTTPGGVR